MAQRTVVELLDDIDGDPAAETVAFAIDGITYEIDLSAQNADRLRTSVAPFVEKARKAGTLRAGRKGKGTPSRTANSRERSAEIRSWAKENGIAVNERGRIPATVVQAYEANDPGKADKGSSGVPQTRFQAVSNP
jgi:hypothetical protein